MREARYIIYRIICSNETRLWFRFLESLSFLSLTASHSMLRVLLGRADMYSVCVCTYACTAILHRGFLACDDGQHNMT